MKGGINLLGIITCTILLLLITGSVAQQVHEFPIFQEQFDHNDLNWPIGNRDYARYEIINNRYRISHFREDVGWIVTKVLPITFPSSYSINTSIKLINGVGAGYGVAFGGSSPSNVHVFAISDKGYYRYSYYENGEYKEIIPWTQTNAVRAEATNNLRIAVEDTDLDFYINDNLVNEVSNVNFFGKRTGFIVYRRQEIEVDYLEITQSEVIPVSQQSIDEEIRTDVGISHYSSRHALVIGNSNYKEAPLKNPVNDAIAVSKTLQELGFKVLTKLNVTRSALRQTILEFEERIANDPGVGLFYYAGHGIQSDGTNYLVPVDAEISREYQIQDECIRADHVLRMMAMLDNPMNIIILDACRNNPYYRSFRSANRGLAQPTVAPTGSIIAFSTAPGRTASDGDGNNGLYTQELISAMKIPGLTLEEVFKTVRIRVSSLSRGEQIPWENSSLMGDFFFSTKD